MKPVGRGVDRSAAARTREAHGRSIAMKLPGFLAAFAHRGFRLLWIGAFLSSIGTWIQDVALSWLIHVQTGDPFYLGLRRFAQDVPLLALMLVGRGVRRPRGPPLILLSSQIVQMVLAVALTVLYFSGHLGIAAIMIIAFLAGLTQSQSAPTYQAVLPSLVPREHIPNAVALNSLQFNTSRAIGPVIAGLAAGPGRDRCLLRRERRLLRRGDPRPVEDPVSVPEDVRARTWPRPCGPGSATSPGPRCCAPSRCWRGRRASSASR